MYYETLTKVRKEQGLSLYDLARMSGVPYSVLYYLEKRGTDIRISTALKIASALNVTLDEIFKDR